jgi:hypothetical protein
MRGYLKSGRLAIGVAMLAAASVMFGAVPASAQEQRSETVQRLVDELRGLITRGDKRRMADPRFLGELKALAQKYDWPWRRVVFRERFRDGDYTRDPAWRVGHGQFWVDGQLGLRTTVEPFERPKEKPQPQQKSKSIDLFGAVMREMTRPQGGETQSRQQPERRVASTPSEIYTRGTIANGFALKLRLKTVSNLPARFEVGPYQGQDRKEGYRLIYYNRKGATVIEMVRMRPWGSSVVYTQQKAPILDDGRSHVVQWTRDKGGNMKVSVDGKPLFSVADTGISGNFQGLTIVNGGGDYGIAAVSVTDAPKASPPR